MKILYLPFNPAQPYWGTNDSFVYVHEFTKAVQDAGHKVHVGLGMTNAPMSFINGTHVLDGTNLDFFRSEQGWADSNLLSDAKAFARNFSTWNLPSGDFDLVYERYSLFSVSGINLARELEVPFFLEVNAPILEEARAQDSIALYPLAEAIEKYLFSQADRIIATSEDAEIYTFSIAPDARVSLIPDSREMGRYLQSSFEAYFSPTSMDTS